MKKLLTLAVLLASVSSFAQGPMTKYLDGRFGGPEKQVFIEKGSRSIGIKGGFRSFNVAGDDATNVGYALLSLLNVGNGQLKIWNVSPSFSTFIADDLSLGVALHYNGYAVDTNLGLDFRDIINTTNEAFNVNISNRSMRHHAGGASLVLRKYVSFFGSKMLGVFGEGRLEGTYGVTTSAPLDAKDFNRERLNNSFSVALKACGGVAVRLQDDTAITVSVPLFGVAYNRSVQNRTTTITKHDEETGADYTTQVKSKAHMSSFNAARQLDLLGIQIGFTRYIKPKKK